MIADKFYQSQCRFNAEGVVLAPFTIHQIILLLLTIKMCMIKDNYVQSTKKALHFLYCHYKYTVSTTFMA